MARICIGWGRGEYPPSAVPAFERQTGWCARWLGDKTNVSAKRASGDKISFQEGIGTKSFPTVCSFCSSALYAPPPLRCSLLLAAATNNHQPASPRSPTVLLSGVSLARVRVNDFALRLKFEVVVLVAVVDCVFVSVYGWSAYRKRHSLKSASHGERDGGVGVRAGSAGQL
jgi:hypothetical protein